MNIHAPAAMARSAFRNKYDDHGNAALATSVGRRWGRAHAELRRHCALDIDSFVQPATEVAIVIDGHAKVDRRGNSDTQRFIARPGTFCICPAGVPVDYLRATGNKVSILHLYFRQPADGGPAFADLSNWPYAGGVSDPLIAQIGAAIAEEMQDETAGGELLFDALREALVARIARRIHRTSESGKDTGVRGLDSQRLTRVLDFLASQIEGTPSLSDIAAEACLSRFHFVRAFKVATGKTPYQYLSALRLERARELLAHDDVNIDAIAYRLRFSNSANFSRAFKRATGFNPCAYRNRFGDTK